MAAARSEPARERAAAVSGRHAREARWLAKATAPAIIASPHTISAAPVDQTAPTPRASGGPSTKVTSTSVDSSANSEGSADGRETIAGSRVRTQADSGGEVSPAAPAST